jgi:hypothetical protein
MQEKHYDLHTQHKNDLVYDIDNTYHNVYITIFYGEHTDTIMEHNTQNMRLDIIHHRVH